MAKTLHKENITPHNFLDCGSGTGLLGGAIHKIWPQSHITGIDFAEAMLARSKLDGCADDTILHNLMDVPWPVADDSFDIVGAASTLNYASDAYEFIASMAQATKPGGYVILSYLSAQSDTEGVTDDGSRVYLWSGNSIESCFSENKVEIITSRDVRSYSGRNLQRVDSIVMGKRAI